VTVDTLRAGWGASIYVSNQPADSLTTLGAWGDAVASGSDLDRTKTFDFGGVKGQSVLVWFTQLPSAQNNNGESKHYVEVAEVKVA
jgi:hypothetical protein